MTKQNFNILAIRIIIDMNFRYCKILKFYILNRLKCTEIILENPTFNFTSLDIKEKLTFSVRFKWVKKKPTFQ